MITEDYVSFEVAKFLKAKGFDWECKTVKFYPVPDYDQESPDGVSALTLQMAMKWLREEKHIPIEILWHYDSDSDVEEWYFVHHAELRILPNDIEYYETYEQACEEAIKYCLENLI